MSLSTHVLDTERGRPAAGVRVELYDGAGGARRRRRDRRRRAHPRARRHHAGHVPHRLSPRVAVLQEDGAGDRAGRGSSPRPVADLVLRVRELPRQLTVEQLAELFEGRTRFVELLAATRIRSAGRARSLSSFGRRAEGGARRAPPIGGTAASARSARRTGTDDDPAVLAGLAELNRAYEERFGFRFVVFVNGRPRREIVPVLERAPAAHPRGGADDGVRRARARSRWTDGARLSPRDYWWGWGNLLFRWLHVIAAMAWIGASFYFIALDNHLEPPKDPRRLGSRRRRRGVGGARRRLLPRREVPACSGAAAGAAALVQVGGVHDLALRVRALHRRLLRARDGVPDRSVGRRPDRVGGDRSVRRRDRAGMARLRRDLPRLRARRSAPRRARVRVHLRFGLGLVESLRATGRLPAGRRDDRDDDGRQRLLRDHPRALGADPRQGGRTRARPTLERPRQDSARCTTTT